MSADNEIAVIKFKDKYAVGMVHGCPGTTEILRYLPTGPRFYEEFTTHDTDVEANTLADGWYDTLEKAGSPTEYGVTCYKVPLTVEEFAGPNV